MWSLNKKIPIQCFPPLQKKFLSLYVLQVRWRKDASIHSAMRSLVRHVSKYTLSSKWNTVSAVWLCGHINSHTQPFNGRWSTWGGRYQKKLTHSHPSWSSDILYQLPPFTTIHSILSVQFTCLTVLFDNPSPGFLWSSSWSWSLYFILHGDINCSYYFVIFCWYVHPFSTLTLKAGRASGL